MYSRTYVCRGVCLCVCIFVRPLLVTILSLSFSVTYEQCLQINIPPCLIQSA